MESGKVGMDFQPLRTAEAQMPVEDQCRVRDRATIMSRHIFASRGDAFADAQVRCSSVLTKCLHVAVLLLCRGLSATSVQAHTLICLDGMQVGKLLRSLNIDPAALPANWEDIYRCGQIVSCWGERFLHCRGPLQRKNWLKM